MRGFAMPPADEKPVSGAVFVAAGEDGVRALSADGKTWSHRQTGKDGETFISAAFGLDCCALFGRYGGDNHFAMTKDGVAWQQAKQDAQYAFFVRGGVFYEKRFLGYGGESGGGGKMFVVVSTDGIKWDPPKPVAGKHLLRCFAQGNGLLVAVGDYGRRAVSRDGIEWKDTPDYRPADSLINIAFGNGQFVGGGLHGLRMRSADGLVWKNRIVGEEGEHINAMIWDGKQFVGIGQGATYMSADAVHWERIPNFNAPTTATWGGGVYVGSLWPGRLLVSTDAIHWTDTARLPQHIEALGHGTLSSNG
jgi:hypothetical protein